VELRFRPSLFGSTFSLTDGERELASGRRASSRQGYSRNGQAFLHPKGGSKAGRYGTEITEDEGMEQQIWSGSGPLSPPPPPRIWNHGLVLGAHLAAYRPDRRRVVARRGRAPSLGHSRERVASWSRRLVIWSPPRQLERCFSCTSNSLCQFVCVFLSSPFSTSLRFLDCTYTKRACQQARGEGGWILGW